jgi:hypothetical protein
MSYVRSLLIGVVVATLTVAAPSAALADTTSRCADQSGSSTGFAPGSDDADWPEAPAADWPDAPDDAHADDECKPAPNERDGATADDISTTDSDDAAVGIGDGMANTTSGPDTGDAEKAATTDAGSTGNSALATVLMVLAAAALAGTVFVVGRRRND